MQKEMLLRQPTDQHDMRFPVILSEPCHPEEFFTTKDLSITLWVNAEADSSLRLSAKARQAGSE